MVEGERQKQKRLLARDPLMEIKPRHWAGRK